MAILDPTATTVGDLCGAALFEAGVVGTGQDASADDVNKAWARLQWMLQQWANQRWLVYHLVTYLLNPTTNAKSYTIGPGGNIDTNYSADQWNNQFNPQFGTGQVLGQPSKLSARPDKIESAFLRQVTQSQPNWIDYPLQLLHSMEDYNKIALKGLVSFPGWIFYDPAWPLGNLFPWPVAQANIYALGICVKEQLPVSFPTLATKLALPFEYYGAILYNLALRLRSTYAIPTFPGDQLMGQAKNSLAVLRGSNSAIAALSIPGDLNRPGIYNIFSDRSY